MEQDSRIPKFLDRAIHACILLLALSAPLSIAATQTAWVLGMLFWIARLILVRPRIKMQSMDLAVIIFLGLTILSTAFSYDQRLSVQKLLSVSLVSIVYLVSANLRDVGTSRKVVALLIVSGIVSVLFSLGMLAVGKNLKVTRLSADSPLRAAGVNENDTILAANGRSVNSPEELMAAVRGSSEIGVARLQIYRYELLLKFDLPVASMLPSDDSSSALGIEQWSRGRDTRASGFFGHYTTYAEVLQLLLALCFGLLIAMPGQLFSRNRLLMAATAFMLCVGLFLTVTRASWAGFLIAVAVIIAVGASRRTLMICVAISIPIAAGGLFYLQQKRNVAFIDTKDGSTTWRMTVWREGFDLLVSDPRHLAVGIGMDSIKSHYLEWGLFDNGRLPIGHMHSTPLQLALERGVPTLIAWLFWILIYLKLLWRGIRSPWIDWRERGLLLGAFGGTAGFLAGGIVHYNWGDSEVVMIFYLIMGMSISIVRILEGPREVDL